MPCAKPITMTTMTTVALPMLDPHLSGSADSLVEGGPEIEDRHHDYQDRHQDYEMHEDYEIVPLLPGETRRNTGTLGIFSAALFIVGEMTGSGILGVPQGLSYSGYSGIGLMLLCVIAASYTGLTLSRNWLHVKDLYPKCSKPYQIIGYTAYGTFGEVIVQICATVTLVGGCCAYVLIAAQSLANFIYLVLGADVVGYRICVVIMGTVFLLVLIFGAGSESFIVAIFATVLSVIFTCLLLVGIFKTGPPDQYRPYQITPKSWFLSFGKFLFAFGGHSAFPNFQKEMKNPRNFPGSILIAFTIKLCLYVPIGVVGMEVFGESCQANIINNIDPSFKVLNVSIFLFVAVQAIMSATILGNPVAAMIEGAIKKPAKNSILKKVAVRSCFVVLTVVICELIPRFDLIMALIGGTTINAAVFILPSLFHIKLARPEWRLLKVSLDVLAILFGLGAGAVCTYASIAHIVEELS